MQVYVDTNVFVDMFEDRHSPSTSFLYQSLMCKYNILISNWVLQELRYIGFESEMQNLLTVFSSKLAVVPITEEDIKEAKRLHTHYSDALHAAIAKRYEVCIVTRNIRDFVGFDARKPDVM